MGQPVRAQWWECTACRARYQDPDATGQGYHHVCRPEWSEAEQRYVPRPDGRNENPDPAAVQVSPDRRMRSIVYRPLAEGRGRTRVDGPTRAAAAP